MASDKTGATGREGNGKFLKPHKGNKRRSKKSEAALDACHELDDDEAEEHSQKCREGHRGYGSRLEEGFGMMGGE